jgi:hypothetical protein
MCLASLFSGPGTAWAVDALVLEVRELRVAGIPVQGAQVKLDLLDDRRTRLTVSADSATLAEPVGRLTAIRLDCDRPVIAEPRFACDSGRLTGRGGPTGKLGMRVTGEFDTATGIARFSGSGFSVAGATARFKGRIDDTGWQVDGATGTTTLSELRAFAAPWFQLPADFTLEGKAAIEGRASDHGRGTNIDATLKLDAVNLSNEASTIVSDQMAMTARVQAALRDADTVMSFDVAGRQGQVLVGPVLLDFGRNPLHLKASSALRGEVMTISTLSLSQQNSLELSGTGSVNLAGETPLVSGDFRIHELEFPAAYTSYLQITLAATLLGDADTAGTLHGEVSVRDNLPTLLHVMPESLVLHDKKDRLYVAKMDGDLWWTPAGAQPRPSRVTGPRAAPMGCPAGAPRSISRPTATISRSRGPPNYPSSTAHWPSRRWR